MINNNLKNIIDKLLNKILPKFDLPQKNLIGKTLKNNFINWKKI